MVAKQQHCYSTAPADKQINTEMLQPTPATKINKTFQYILNKIYKFFTVISLCHAISILNKGYTYYRSIGTEKSTKI